MKQVNGIENEICELEKKAERNIFSTVVLKSIYITLSVVMFVMFVFSLVLSENSHPYYMSSIIFALLSIVFALTSYFYKEYRNGHRNWIMPGGKVIIVGWFFVFILLLIRLVSYQVYNSSIFAFDFGPKNCRMKSAVNSLNKTIQGVKCETIHSYSFTFDSTSDAFNSIGHTFQGFLCICMFCQARFKITNFVVRQLAKFTVKSERDKIESDGYLAFNASEIHFIKISRMFDMLLLIVWVYPCYNAVKRIVKSSDTFSTSSYGNNSFEWACGFLIGLSLGFLIEAHGRNDHTDTKFNNKLKSTFSSHTIKSYDSSVLLKSLEAEENNMGNFEHKWHLARTTSGVLLIISGVIAMIFYIVTWGSAVADNGTVTDSNVSSINEAFAAISLIFICLPCLSCMLVPLCTKHEIVHRQTSYASFRFSHHVTKTMLCEIDTSDEKATIVTNVANISLQNI
jgi:hypothetical protein